jgi:hypothetical protein
MGGIVGGTILIFIGIIHIASPEKVSRFIRSVYSKSPFVKDEKALGARRAFIVVLGIVWFLLGSFLLIQSLVLGKIS